MKTPAEIFNELAEKNGAGLCRPVATVTAYPVKKGEEAVAPGNFGMEVEFIAPADGWQVVRDGEKFFYENDDFEAEYAPVKLDRRHAVPLPSGAHLRRLSSGDTFLTYPLGPGRKPVRSIAKEPAFLLTPVGKPPVYLGETYALMTYDFQYGHVPRRLKELFVQKSSRGNSDKTQEAVRYVVVQDKTLVDHSGQGRELKAGTILYENAADPNGYTPLMPEIFIRQFQIETPANSLRQKQCTAQDNSNRIANLRRYIGRRRS
ncbi:MAG: hypothetical protein EA357_05145 [Micavibrio sp.]|nr:MAG: hypothetical protein EA357_05145 [Micavibrio sp.]